MTAESEQFLSNLFLYPTLWRFDPHSLKEVSFLSRLNPISEPFGPH
jgi:hypothetical protein